MYGLRMIRRTIVVFFCCLCGLGYADQTGSPTQTHDLSQFRTNHIYIILSRQAQFSKISGGYKLQMQQVHPDILVFTPPPIQDSSLVGIQDFINIWNSKKVLLDKSPPFGAIVFKSFKVLNKTDLSSYVLPIYSPVYNPAKNTLSFIIKTAANFDNLVGYHESVALFIE